LRRPHPHCADTVAQCCQHGSACLPKLRACDPFPSLSYYSWRGGNARDFAKCSQQRHWTPLTNPLLPCWAQDSVTSLAVGKTEIIAGSVDGTVRRFDVRMGRAYTDQLHHAVTSVALSHDGARPVTRCLASAFGLPHFRAAARCMCCCGIAPNAGRMCPASRCIGARYCISPSTLSSDAVTSGALSHYGARPATLGAAAPRLPRCCPPHAWHGACVTVPALAEYAHLGGVSGMIYYTSASAPTHATSKFATDFVTLRR
jgi:hypothetical protein